MIPKPKDATRSYVHHREEQIKKIALFIESKVTEHLGKYPMNDDNVHAIIVPMSEHRDFGFWWADYLEEKIKGALEASGWQVQKLAPAAKNNVPCVEIELALPQEEIEALDLFAEQEREEVQRNVLARQRLNA
jgi:hypothetical protein